MACFLDGQEGAYLWPLTGTYLFFLMFSLRLMQASIDTTAVDRGPIVDNKIEIALFYIFFVVVFSFFFINIFVALIILTFQEQGEKDQGDCELDRNQVRRMRDKCDCVTQGMRDSKKCLIHLGFSFPSRTLQPYM